MHGAYYQSWKRFTELVQGQVALFNIIQGGREASRLAGSGMITNQCFLVTGQQEVTGDLQMLHRKFKQQNVPTTCPLL